MTREQFTEKYDEAIRAVAVANDVDMGVGMEMLAYGLKCAAGVMERVDTYKGVPEELNLAEAYEDYKSIAD